jgi:hypothetical protein
VYALHSSVAIAPCFRHIETFHPPRFPCGAGKTKIPTALLT